MNSDEGVWRWSRLGTSRERGSLGYGFRELNEPGGSVLLCHRCVLEYRYDDYGLSLVGNTRVENTMSMIQPGIVCRLVPLDLRLGTVRSVPGPFPILKTSFFYSSTIFSWGWGILFTVTLVVIMVLISHRFRHATQPPASQMMQKEVPHLTQ